MTATKKQFSLGILTGAALALIVLQAWGHYLDQNLVSAAQPTVLRPVVKQQLASLPLTSDDLPNPLLSQIAGQFVDTLQIQRLDGNPISLSELHGKVIFINLWSADCAPCRHQLPGIQHLYDSLKKDPVAFLMIAGDDKESLRDFLKRAGNFTVPVFLPRQKLPPTLRREGIPVNLILDSTGRIVYRDAGAANWDSDEARAFIRGLENQTKISQ